MAKVIIFIVVSVGFAFLTRASLRDPRSHGFYRLFAFMAIAALILLNSEHWFRHPFSVRQIVSWLLLFASAILALHGFYLLRFIGEPQAKAEHTTLLGFEKTTKSVIVGAYKYIRHPLYCSLLCLGWGAFFKHLSWLAVIFVLMASAFLIATAKVEESENIRKFGSDYIAYMKATKMFIPFLF